MLREGKNGSLVPARGVLSPRRHSSDNLSDHLAGEVRVERVMGHLRAGPHLDKDHFVTYTSCSLR